MLSGFGFTAAGELDDDARVATFNQLLAAAPIVVPFLGYVPRARARGRAVGNTKRRPLLLSLSLSPVLSPALSLFVSRPGSRSTTSPRA